MNKEVLNSERIPNSAGQQDNAYMLVDGAQFPEIIGTLLRTTDGIDWREVYAGTIDEILGDAGLFLVKIKNQDCIWPATIDALDQLSPCLVGVHTTLPIDSLLKHFQAFLNADLGDNVTGMIRYFDPRNLDAVLKVWDEATRHRFLGPLTCLYSRGHHETWQRIDGLCQTTKPRGPAKNGEYQAIPVIVLDQKQQDQLMQHCEPDLILSTLIANEYLKASQPYLARYKDFMTRYKRAQGWSLSNYLDLYHFCRLTYLYGPEFEFHTVVRAALQKHILAGQPMEIFSGQVPDQVWHDIKQEALKKKGKQT